MILKHLRAVVASQNVRARRMGGLVVETEIKPVGGAFCSCTISGTSALCLGREPVLWKTVGRCVPIVSA